jgi:hypothetical protein
LEHPTGGISSIFTTGIYAWRGPSKIWKSFMSYPLDRLLAAEQQARADTLDRLMAMLAENRAAADQRARGRADRQDPPQPDRLAAD